MFGIPIQLHYSWFLVFGLFLWMLAGVAFPRAHPEESLGSVWAAGFTAAILFFASVLVHELSHSLVAKALGLRVVGITLFVFGGVSSLASDPDDPWTEMKVALAGPVASFFLAALFLSLWMVAEAAGTGSPLVAEVLRYLSAANLVLGIFNLVPGFPLDGGRVLRALWWLATGSFARATRMASRVGAGVAVAVIVLGGLQLAGGALDGAWLVLIGLFLWGAAGAAGREGILRDALGEVRVEEVMIREPASIPADSTVQDAVERFFLDQGHAGFPVARDGDVCGIVTLLDLERVPSRRRPWVAVCDVMTPRDALPELAPTDSLRAAVEHMARAHRDRLLVVAGGRVVGLLTEGSVRRFLRLRHLRAGAAG